MFIWVSYLYVPSWCHIRKIFTCCAYSVTHGLHIVIAYICIWEARGLGSLCLIILTKDQHHSDSKTSVRSQKLNGSHLEVSWEWDGRSWLAACSWQIKWSIIQKMPRGWHCRALLMERCLALQALSYLPIGQASVTGDQHPQVHFCGWHPQCIMHWHPLASFGRYPWPHFVGWPPISCIKLNEQKLE